MFSQAHLTTLLRLHSGQADMADVSKKDVVLEIMTQQPDDILLSKYDCFLYYFK